MRISSILVVMAVIILAIFFIPTNTIVYERDTITEESQLNNLIREFLESKKSPLASETNFLLQQKYWGLLIAVSAIESQYCIRKLGNNCFGIGGDSTYRYYSSVRASIIDANNLIEYWQERGRWLTVEDMNCHFVVPCNQNWVDVVNDVLEKFEAYERQSIKAIYQ